MSKIEQYIVLKDGRKLGFAEYGNDNGFPIVYCHGSQSSRLEMHYDLSFAFENNLRIITIDRPGHGLSDFNPSGSILSFARDVKELTEHLEVDKFSVMGMSAGCPFALGISYSFPDNVYKTSIISGFAPYNKESKKYLSKQIKLMLGFAHSFPFLLKLLLNIQIKKLNKNPKKVFQSFLKIMSQPDQEILKNESVMEILEQMFKEAFRNGSKGVSYEISYLLTKEWRFNLKDIKVPVTFWQGVRDNNVPFEWAELMANKINGSTLRMYPDEGHLIIFQHTKEIFGNVKENVA